MQAFRFIETAENGLLKLNLPKEIENSRVEVIVLPIEAPIVSELSNVSTLKKFKGDAQFPSIDTSKTDVYHQ